MLKNSTYLRYLRMLLRWLELQNIFNMCVLTFDFENRFSSL